MTKITDTQREALSTIGRMGGKKTAQKYGKKHMRSLGKKGSQKRWEKKDNI